MAALTPVTSVEALASAIQKSGLLPANKLEKVRQTATQAADPKQLARELIKDGTLTRWQAGQLLHGYHALVIGRYRLLEELGAVPTGRVYLVEHAQFGRRHTLKVLAKRLAANPRAVKHFLSSAQNACGLDHRNISHVYDVNQDGDRHYVVMEHVEGENLERIVGREGQASVLQALDFIAQAAEGLAHAHASGVVHGDLKPSNLLLDQTGTIKILEIGQTGTGATFEAEDAEESVEMAALAAVIFQAPELRGDGEVADIACDVYSLGSVLCFLLTAKAAADEVAARKGLEALGGIPSAVLDMCCRWMADKPADRPTTMGIVLDDLAAVARQLSPPNKQGGEKRPLEKALVEKTPAEKRPSEPTPASEKKESPAAATAPPPAKAKKPPVAKSLDEEVSPRIVIPDAPQPVIEPEPIGPVVIKTRGRIGKKPAMKKENPPAEPPGASSAADATTGSPAKTYTPLILAGAIGGGGVLVLGLIVAVVCLLTLGHGKKQMAQNDKPIASAPAAAARAAVAKTESNPDGAADEKNPDVTVAAPPSASASEVAESSGPAAGSSSTKESKETGVKEATAEPAAASTAFVAPGQIKREASPETKSEPKPAPKPENTTSPASPAPAKPAPAKPAAVKPAPKSEPKRDPLKGLAAAVSLPVLPEKEGQPATEALTPLVLGPCNVDEKTPLDIRLIGGDAATRSTRQKFDLQPRAGSSGDWSFILSGGPTPATIADLTVKDANLVFQWTDDGLKQAAVAKQLCNCALRLEAGSATQVVALRTAVLASPLVIEIDKPGSAKWNVGDLPLAKQLSIEITRLEETKAHKKEPSGPVNVGESITVWTGPTEKIVPLGLKLTSSATARGIEVKLQPQVKLEGQEVAPYRKKEMQNLLASIEAELPLLDVQLGQAKNARPSSSQTNPFKAVMDKRNIEERKAALTVQLNQKMAMKDQLNYLVGWTDTFQGTAKVHFHVYIQAGDTKIDVLRTEEEPPEKPKSR